MRETGRKREREREKERERERQREREKERDMFLKYDASSFAYLIYAYFFIDTFFWDSPSTFFLRKALCKCTYTFFNPAKLLLCSGGTLDRSLL